MPTVQGSLDATLQKARQLILRYGRNATSYQLLNPGLTLWFSDQGEGVIGYVQASGRRIVAGEPVGPQSKIEELADRFETESRQAGIKVCYFGAEEPLAKGPGVDRILLGAQPYWDPSRWSLILARKPSLRAQLSRARNKQVHIERWSPEMATGHPELHRCLREWLDTRGLPPMHFLVEPETLDRLYDRQILVAKQGDSVVGFLVASPIPERTGWLIEQIIRGRSAPNGTSELLIDATLRHLAAPQLGVDYVTLGLSPLSQRCGLEEPTARWWIVFLLAWIRAHGRRFYDFDGLDFFKAKLQPEGWEPVYAVTRGRRLGLRDLYAIAGAFSGSPPLLFLGRGLGRATRAEFSSLVSKR